MMKIYKWEGRGHYIDATVIVSADCLKSAKEMIEYELINTGLAKSWEKSEEIEELDTNDCKVLYSYDGDY